MADDEPEPCEWFGSCPSPARVVLVRTPYRGAETERVPVCDHHLPYAWAKGYRPPEGEAGA